MKTQRTFTLPLLAGLALLACLPANALQGGNVMPEYLQFEPADAPDMVNMITGDFSYTLPLGEVPGPYGSYPLSMSYHPGIGPNMEATWVGLGWTLNPGAINRNLRGAPDDQFHGGELSYIYSYAASSNWGVYTGYSYGPFSVNNSYNSGSGYGITAGVGVNLGDYAKVGLSYGSDGLLTLDASVGMKGSGVGIQGSVTFGPDGYVGSSLGIMAYGATKDGGTASASIGVHHTSGRGMAGNAGFGYSPKPNSGDRLNSKGEPMVPGRRYSGISISDNNVSVRGYGAGTNVSIPGSSISVGSSNGAVDSKHSWTGVGIVVPTQVGIFSAGYTRNIDEVWVRQATSEYLYGYMYQAGPAIFTDAKTNEMNIPALPGGGTDPNGWRWNYKGKSLDRVGNPVNGDLLPGYDMYGVAANGVSGTFRPYALSGHRLFENVGILEAGDNQAQTEYWLLKEDAAGKQSEEEFPAANAMTRYAYDYCYDEATKAASFNTSSDASKLADMIAGRCSRYAILASNHLNESNRMVLSSDPFSVKPVRSRMLFRFVGENGGYFSSEDPDRKPTKYGQHELDGNLFQRDVNGVTYGLFGSRRIDPILEGGLNNGRLQGFRITNPDGTQFFFTQPVRSIISADYTTNRAMGAPLFVDKSAPGANDHFWNVIENAFKTFWRMSKGAVTDLPDGLKTMAGWSFNLQMWPYRTLGSFFWSSPQFKDKCEAAKPDAQYNFSYSMKVNPYATQWLLTEVRGPEFVELDRNDMSKNIGYQVKFTYTEPYWYKWRFPFAPPNMDKDSLPNFRMAKNAATPEDCHSDLYNASFGVKEMVYLSSIETSTHKAQFNLNDPATESRVDGKGWIQDWTGRSQDPDSPAKKATAMPIYLDAQIEVTQTPGAGSWASQCAADMEDQGDAGMVQVGTTCWWERTVDYRIGGAYLNVMPTAQQIARVTNKQVSIGGVTGGVSGYHAGSNGQGSYPSGFDFTGYGENPLKLPNNEPPSIKALSPAIGHKLALGSSFIEFNTALTQTGKYRTAFVTAGCGDACNPPALAPMPADGSIPPSFRLGGAGSLAAMQPLLLYNDFVETSGNDDNQMRYLKSVRILDKAENMALRQFEMDYDYEIAPGTLNSYPAAPGPQNGPPDLISRYPKDSDLEGLDGKLKLKSVREVACLSADCIAKVPMPPFKFYYKDEQASSLKQGEDRNGTIIASSNPQDEWGFWNIHATPENHKVRQDFATKGAVTWSMDKVVDPAGGQLEIEYERDTYKGENYADETKGYPISWRKCPNSLGRDPDNLCIDVLPRRWQTYCNRNDQLEGEYVHTPKTDPVDADYAYLLGMTQLGVPAQATTLYFQLDGTYEFSVGCGAGIAKWKWNSCPRHRAVGLLGSGEIVRIVEDKLGTYIPFLDATIPAVRTVEVKVPYQMVYDDLIHTGRVLTGRKAGNDIDPSKGLIWLQNVRTDIKGGDLRVAKLVKRDIGLVQTTRYEYATGEMAQYPDSVLSTAFAERYSPSKAISVMPLTYLPGISRVPGVNDAEAAFLPGATVTYPKVTVMNISKTADTVYNGKTVYEFITPETGIPMRAGGPDPFVKALLSLKLRSGNAYGTLSLQFRDALGNNLGAPVAMTRLSGSRQNQYAFEASDPAAPYKNAYTLVLTYTSAGKISTSTLKLRSPGDILKEYADIALTAYYDGGPATPIFIASLADHRGSAFAPLLVRTTPVGHPSTAYLDYTAFLGKPKNTEFHRFIPSGPTDYNDPANQVASKYRLIKGDSTVYSATAPSGDNRFFSDGHTRRGLIGKDEEKWEFTRKIKCNDATLPVTAGAPNCDFTNAKGAWSNYEGFEATAVANAQSQLVYAPKEMTYVRNPAFVVETISKTGFNGSTGPEDYIVTRTTNHRFDPVTGAPTMTATFTGRPGQAAPAKANRLTPAYTVATPLAYTMFERNMLFSNLREDAYTWDVAPTVNNQAGGTAMDFDAQDPATSTAYPPRLTAVKLTPFTQGHPVNEVGYPDRSGATTVPPRSVAVRDNPILGMGSFSPRFALDTEPGRTLLSNNALLFTPSFADGTFLKQWSGSRIVRVNDFLKPLEERNVYGFGMSHRYDPTGFHKIGLFGNAGYTETALLTPEGRRSFPDVSAWDAWRYSTSVPEVAGNFLRFTDAFAVSHPLHLPAGAAAYLVEFQALASAPRTCQAQIYTDAGAIVATRDVAVKVGLSAYQASLDGASAAPSTATRVRLACGGAGTFRLSYLRAYPEKGEAISYVYDAKGSMVQSVNEQNVSSYYEYDAFGILISMRNDDGVLYSTHKRELTNVATP